MKKKFSAEKIIDQIEKVRKKNNSNWMDVLRLAFRANPKKASLIMSKIYSDDTRISRLARKLTKIK
jgi:hypothetical protein